MNQITTLRSKHPKFIYDSYQIVNNTDNLTIIYKFILEPNIVFRPQITIPQTKQINIKQIENLIFHLGLIEMISYWKSTCSPQIIIKAGYLDNEQINWWKNEIIKGLGEFWYLNQIDFTTNNFLNIFCPKSSQNTNHTFFQSNIKGNLILTSGGKDSIVTLNLLPKTDFDNLLLLNPTPNTIDIANLAEFYNPIIIKRDLDPLLLRMNNNGYLNGHTPFSAFLAFLGILFGSIYNFQYVIASNEQSANEGNIKYRNLIINHQYSKSYEFEKNFREYANKYLTKSPEYFSFLRPLSEIQIAQIFSNNPQFFNKFVSCNKLGGKIWCKKCAKCAFIYLILSSFLSESDILGIFKENLWKNPKIQAEIQKLLGIIGHKPFDCVGTKDESIYALCLFIQKRQSKNLPLPVFVIELIEKLHLDKNKITLILNSNLLKQFHKKNYLPPNYQNILEETINSLFI